MFGHVLLMPEQEEVLALLVEASRAVDRKDRQKFLLAGTTLVHPGLPEGHSEVLSEDLETLASQGLLSVSFGSKGTPNYFVTPAGFHYYEEIKQRAGEAIAQVDEEIHSLIQSDEFLIAYPEAHSKCTAAAELLWHADSAREGTTIGHLSREALQAFATSLVQKYEVSDVPNDPQKDVARIRGVLDRTGSRLGKTEKALLDALLTYWGAVTDLAHRQEHGARREGESLVWEDARRLVFQVAVLFYEFHHSLRRLSRA